MKKELSLVIDDNVYELLFSKDTKKIESAIELIISNINSQYDESLINADIIFV